MKSILELHVSVAMATIWKAQSDRHLSELACLLKKSLTSLSMVLKKAEHKRCHLHGTEQMKICKSYLNSFQALKLNNKNEKRAGKPALFFYLERKKNNAFLCD